MTHNHSHASGESTFSSKLSRRSVLKLAGAVGAAGTLGVTGTGPAGAVPVGADDIDKQDAIDAIEYDIEHPRVNATPETLQRARENAENTAWGAAIRDAVVERAETMPAWMLGLYFDGETSYPEETWLELSDEMIRSLAPITAPDGDVYHAFPYPKYRTLDAGVVCPIDGSPLTIDSYDDPGHVHCHEQGHVFPDETYDGIAIEDDGDGWDVPDDVPDDWAASDYVGETFYFVAEWNGWLFRMMENSALMFAYAYAFTDETKYAETAATLLDVMATVTPRSHDELFGRPTEFVAINYNVKYDAGHTSETLSLATDFVLHSDALDGESPTNPGMEMKENIAENLLVEYADYCWRDMYGGIDGNHADYSTIYHNGTMTYMEGMVSPASCLDIDVGYAEFFLDGQVSLSNFLSNTIFRDGTYYETSSFYSASYLAPAELAYFLETDTYPNGRNFYANPRFIDLNVSAPKRQSVAGREPYYGDTFEVDTDVRSGPVEGSFYNILRFYARASGERKDEYAQMLAEIADGDPDQYLENPTAGFPPGGIGYWEVAGVSWPAFNIDGSIDGYDPDEIGRTPEKESELLPGKGMAMLRPEDGFSRGAMMRYGATLSHGHYEQLGLWTYAGGREMSYDPGRKPKLQTKVGFNRQTIAHNTVTVNAISQSPPEDDGGSVNLFANRDGYTVVDAENPQAYAHEDVDEYRRTLVYVDTGADRSYTFDIFRVAGGETADYSFHGHGVNFDTDLDLGDPAEGSLASTDYYWGDEVTRSGKIESFREKGANFNPPPGNGYGYLGHPRTASGDATWSAEWAVDPSRGKTVKMRLTMLGDDDRTVSVVDAPDHLLRKLGHDETAEELPYAVARDEGGTSQFVSVVDAVADEYQVDTVEELDVPGHGDATFAPVAAKLTLVDGRTDYVLSTLEGEQFTAKDGRARLNTDAEFALVRVDDDGIASVRMERGTHIHVKLPGEKPITVDADGDEHTGSVLDVDHGEPSLLVDADLPEGDALAGQYLLVDAEEYSHNSPYLVERVSPEGDGVRVHLQPTTTVLSRATVGKRKGSDVLHSPTRFPFTNTEANYTPDSNGGNEYLDGRKVVNGVSGEATTVESVAGNYQDMTVADDAGFDVGDTFIVRDIKAGDRVTVPLSVALTRTSDGHEIEANHDVNTNQ